jgi:hypothetical protein
MVRPVTLGEEFAFLSELDPLSVGLCLLPGVEGDADVSPSEVGITASGSMT